jgi:hypothetical protein
MEPTWQEVQLVGAADQHLHVAVESELHRVGEQVVENLSVDIEQ